MLERIGDISVLHLSGEVGPHEMEDIVETIESLMRTEWNKIILDFREVTHVHYSTLSTLIAKKLEVQVNDGNLWIANASDYHRKIFQFAGADQYFEEECSLSEAVLDFATTQQ